MTQAQELTKQGKTEDARLLLEKALQQEPENTSAHFALAKIFQKNGRELEALDHLRSAAKDGKPEHLSALARATLQAYLENPAAGALEIQVKDSARKLQALGDPTVSAEVARIEGYLAVLERRNEDAIRHFNNALVMDPKLEDVRLSLQQQLLANGQEARAQALITGPAKEVLIDTYYLHTLAKSGCQAAETFLVSQMESGSGLASSLKLAAHKRRCGGPAAEDVVLAPLRSKSSITRTEALLLGDYDAQQSNWPQALAMYEKAASLPDSPGAPDGSIEIRLSSALIGTGHFEKASKILDAYIAQHPQDANAKGQRGLLRLNAALPNANPAAGLQDLREALATPDAKILPALRLQFAMHLVRLGYLPEARRELQASSRLMPGSLAVALLGAELDLRDDRPQSAEKTVRDILIQAPKQREARLILALSLNALGQAKEAIAELRKLLKDYPNDQSIQVQLLAALATVPQSAENPEIPSLINLLEKQSQLTPQTKFILAEILYQSGKTDKAVALWESLATQNQDARAQLRLSEVALMQGQSSEACPKLEQLASQENTWPASTRAQWWALRAICAESRKDAATAIQAHRKAIELSPKDPVFANNLASTLADQGQNLDEAQRLAEGAVAAQPTNVQYLDTLGWVYYRKGDQNRARKIYQQLSGISPLPPNVQSHLSSVLGAR